MRTDRNRTVLTVTKHLDRWAVEMDGEYMDLSSDKEAACAAANRRARAMMDGGEACQVLVSGESFRFGLR